MFATVRKTDLRLCAGTTGVADTDNHRYLLIAPLLIDANVHLSLPCFFSF
jgi:hypothetical protein